MKTIKEASRNPEFNSGLLLSNPVMMATKAFSDGVKFAQRFIPVEEKIPEVEKQVIIKTTIEDDFYIAYLLDGQFHTVEKDDLIDLEQVIGWRPIELK